MLHTGQSFQEKQAKIYKTEETHHCWRVRWLCHWLVVQVLRVSGENPNGQIKVLYDIWILMQS